MNLNLEYLFIVLLHVGVLTNNVQGQSQCCLSPFVRSGDIFELDPPPQDASHSGGGTNAREAESSEHAFIWKEQKCLSRSEETYVSILMSNPEVDNEVNSDGEYFFDSGVASRQNRWSGQLPAGNYDSFMIHGDKQGPDVTFDLTTDFENPIVAIVYQNRPQRKELNNTDNIFGFPGTTYSDASTNRNFDLDGADNWMIVSQDKKSLTVKMVVRHNMNDIRVITEGCCDCGTRAAGSQGDPHIATWSGEHYDYHGVCDLVLVENYAFEADLGMSIHIRTKKLRSWSYISNAVIRIGEDTFELMGGKGGTSQYWSNGILGKYIQDKKAILPVSISGYPILFRLVNSKQHKYIVDLGNDEMITMKTWNSMIRVDVQGATAKNFEQSQGLMGSFNGGKHLARDGVTQLKDINAFGQEWQVLSSEPMLFHDKGEGPQNPQPCVVPSTVDVRRRLGESSVTQQQAEIACSRASPPAEHDLCIFDVMATNNIDVADAYY